MLLLTACRSDNKNKRELPMQNTTVFPGPAVKSGTISDSMFTLEELGKSQIPANDNSD